MPQTSEYIALRQDDDSTSGDRGYYEVVSESIGTRPVKRGVHSLLMQGATILIVICTVIDIACSLHQSPDGFVPSKPQKMLSRTSYVNLDQVYRNTSLERTKRGPIVNHPRGVAQISFAEPHRIFPQYDALILDSKGWMVPDTQRLLVTQEISTVAQFRVLDFGMESCSLSVALSDDDTHFQNNETVGLEIWSLAVDHKLLMSQLSWATRPPLEKYIGTLTLSRGGKNELPQSQCQSGSYMTFEIRCSMPRCFVDITGLGTTISGLHMKQYQTV